jgi:bloom syndrome protein
MNGKIKIIAATITFGMGIDKPDVRFVVLFSLPRSLKGYYQESGRAGRDDFDSTCLLMFTQKDVAGISKVILRGDSIGNKKDKKILLVVDKLLSHVIGYANKKIECRRKTILKYFGEEFEISKCQIKCDNCKNKSNSNLTLLNLMSLLMAMILLY